MVKRQLILLFILPLCLFGQTKSLNKADLTKAYSQAIADFIVAANQKNNSRFDTLFFGKHNSGEGDHFPDIDLPKTIENTQIRVISPELGEKMQKERKSRIYINLFGWVDKQKAEFTFFVFSNGFDHQYNYNINYKYNSKKKTFELEKLKFNGPPFK